MTSYFDFTDLKTAIIGLVTGVIGGLIVLGIARYWSNRSIKSLKRRLQENEAYKARLDNLARSDRALLIVGFQSLLALLAMLFLTSALFLLIRESRPALSDMAFALLCLMFAVLAIGLIKTLEAVRDYPKSVERINEKITELKKKLLGRGDE